MCGLGLMLIGAGGFGLWATCAACGVKSALPRFGAPEIDTGLDGTGEGPERPVRSSFAGSLVSFGWGVLCCVILMPPAFTVENNRGIIKRQENIGVYGFKENVRYPTSTEYFLVHMQNI